MSHHRISVEPTEDIFGGHVVHDLMIELFPDVKREAGDFAFAGSHRSAHAVNPSRVEQIVPRFSQPKMPRILQRSWETNGRSARSRRERKGEKAPVRFLPGRIQFSGADASDRFPDRGIDVAEARNPSDQGESR